MCEIRISVMGGDELSFANRRHKRDDPANQRVQLGCRSSSIGSIGCRIAWIDFCEARRHLRNHGLGIDRIKPDVGIDIPMVFMSVFVLFRSLVVMLLPFLVMRVLDFPFGLFVMMSVPVAVVVVIVFLLFGGLVVMLLPFLVICVLDLPPRLFVMMSVSITLVLVMVFPGALLVVVFLLVMVAIVAVFQKRHPGTSIKATEMA